MQTASWGRRRILLPNDDLPNSGKVTLATLPGGRRGDMDADGDVDGSDLADFVFFYNAGSALADINGDGVINALDIQAFAAQMGH